MNISQLQAKLKNEIGAEEVTNSIGKIEKEIIQMLTLHFLPFSLVNSFGDFAFILFTSTRTAPHKDFTKHVQLKLMMLSYNDM